MPTEPIVKAAFTEEQAAKLTGVSVWQLRYWSRDQFFVPSLGKSPRGIIGLYSFRDLASLRVLNALRNEAKVPLSHLREVKKKLLKLGESIWLSTTLFVLNKRVVFQREGEQLEEVVSGQGVLQIPLKLVSGDLQRDINKLKARTHENIGRFEKKRGIVANRLVIAGTRIPVDTVKSFGEAGFSIEQIIREYPTLTENDIRAALNHKPAA